MIANQKINDFLKAWVPPEIQAIKNRGGFNDRDLAWLQQDINDDLKDENPLNVFMRADEYLLYPSDIKKFQRGMLVFRKTIALMSFFPGGISLSNHDQSCLSSGITFDSTIEGFVKEWRVEHGQS